MTDTKSLRELTIETPMLTILEVADLLRVHRCTIYRLIKERKLPHFRVGVDFRFDGRQILAWMEARRCDKGTL